MNQVVPKSFSYLSDLSPVSVLFLEFHFNVNTVEQYTFFLPSQMQAINAVYHETFKGLFVQHVYYKVRVQYAHPSNISRYLNFVWF